ncbi:alpha/beta fold hydrolase [Acidisphaera sp. S103]|uniref:alpha/beta hydrolase n=1 Tax=Acidisphaera sp. S103 TaxID=1747223 RepID=UPI00131E309C|nr:alpha/beta fold hydrolase [Acidisphaera sp. S103]
MTDHVRVGFKTIDGVTLRGDFFAAEGTDLPCVVMTQGLCLLKEHYIHDHARKFRDSGVSVLVYDHRGYGSSDGGPRHETNPLQQAEDYHDAISAAMRLPGVNAARIAIWGIGHSGGAAMIAAANEPRIKAVILNMPFQSGSYDAGNFPPGLLGRVWGDRKIQTASGNPEPAYVQLWPVSLANARGEEGERTFLTGEVVWEFISGALKRSQAAGTPWENKFTLQSFYHLSSVEPRLFVPRISPEKLLYVAAAEDPVTGSLEAHRAVFATAQQGAEFAVVRPHHLGTYFGEAFDEAMAVQVEFLKRKI